MASGFRQSLPERRENLNSTTLPYGPRRYIQVCSARHSVLPAGVTAFPARLASPGIREIACQMGGNSNTLCRESNLMERAMALSIQIDPILEAQIVQEAKRLGMSEADFVKDILERALGFKNPYQLLQQVRSGAPTGDPHASEHTGEKFKAKLHAQRTP